MSGVLLRLKTELNGALISGKRINTVSVFLKRKTLLVDSGQDSVVSAQAFESLRVPLEQGELAFPI